MTMLTDRQKERKKERKKENQLCSIDIVKFIMAVCVIAIHTHPLENCSNAYIINFYSFFLSLAVPFFFVASAYLLFYKMDGEYNSYQNLNKIKQYILKILKLYLVWNIVYLPISIFGYCYKDNSLLFSIAHYVRGLFLLGEHFYSWILWYLLSTIYSVILIYYLLKHEWTVLKIFVISIIIFSVGSFFNYIIYNQADLNGILLWISKGVKILLGNGRLLTGMVYLSLGIIFAKYTEKFKFSPLLSLACLLAIFAAATSNIFAGFTYIRLLAVFFLFHFIMSIELPKQNFYIKMRTASTVMYFSHMIFYFIWSYFTNSFSGNGQYGFKPFVFSLILSILLSVLVIRFKSKNSNIIKLLFG